MTRHLFGRALKSDAILVGCVTDYQFWGFLGGFFCFCFGLGFLFRFIKDVFTFSEMPGKKMNSSEKTSLKKLKQP